MTWVAPITFSAATTLTAAQMNQNVRDNTNALSDRIQCVTKTSDQIVNNSTTLVNDSVLKFTAVAGQVYQFTANLIHVSATNATPDIAIAFTFPTGTMGWTGIGLDTAATTTVASVRIAATAGAASGTSLAFGVLNSGTSGTLINGSYSCTTGGTVQLQWAQSVATAVDLTVKATSFIQAIRVST